MEIHDAPAMALADEQQGVGELFLDDVFAKRTELKSGAADIDQSRDLGRDEPHHIAENIAEQPGGRREQQSVINARRDAFEPLTKSV